MILRYTAGRIRGVASSFHITSSSTLSRAVTSNSSSIVVFPSSLVSGRFSTMSTDTQSTSMSSKSKYYTIGITGSTGLIGTALQNQILSLGQEPNKGINSGSISGGGVTTVNGKPVRIITFHRGKEAEILNDPKSFFNDTTFTKQKSITWNPYANTDNDNDDAVVAIDTTVIQHLDAILHLSGENISTGEQGSSVFAPFGIRPWTESKKKEIIHSRTITTSALASAISKSGNTNCDFIVASGIGVYGNDYFKNENDNDTDNENNNEKEAADETMDITNTTGFLANVSRLWEAASKIPEPVTSEQAQVQATQGSNSTSTSTTNRVCQLRNGVVLSTLGGALGKLYPIFLVGGGGIVGDTNGNQYFPFISSRDMSRAILHILQTSELNGVININAPIPATNKDFTVAMGTIMNRPVVIPFPKFAVQLLFGEMGEEILLGGTKALPKKLLDSGFQFLDPTINDAVRFAIKGE